MRLTRSLQQWLQLAILAAWVLALLYLLLTKRYTDYLRPEFGLLLLLALLIALGFMVAFFTISGPADLNVPAAFRAMVLLMPLLFLMLLPHSILGGDTFSQRFTGANSIAEGPTNDIPKNKASFSEQTILDLFRHPDRYEGRQVRFTGMIMRDSELAAYFGRETAIYRFLITCCIADAMPLAISVAPELVEAFAVDAWVRVEGRFELGEWNGNPVPRVTDGKVTPVEAPKFPYLF